MPPQVSTNGDPAISGSRASSAARISRSSRAAGFGFEHALALERRRRIERPARGRRKRARKSPPTAKRMDPGSREGPAGTSGASRKLAGTSECTERVAVRDGVAAVGAPADRDRRRPGLALEEPRRRREARDRVEHRQLRHADPQRAAEEARPGAGGADHGARRDAAVLGDDAGDAPRAGLDAAHGRAAEHARARARRAACDGAPRPRGLGAAVARGVEGARVAGARGEDSVSSRPAMTRVSRPCSRATASHSARPASSDSLSARYSVPPWWKPTSSPSRAGSSFQIARLSIMSGSSTGERHCWRTQPQFRPDCSPAIRPFSNSATATPDCARK